QQLGYRLAAKHARIKRFHDGIGVFGDPGDAQWLAVNEHHDQRSAGRLYRLQQCKLSSAKLEVTAIAFFADLFKHIPDHHDGDVGALGKLHCFTELAVVRVHYLTSAGVIHNHAHGSLAHAIKHGGNEVSRVPIGREFRLAAAETPVA